MQKYRGAHAQSNVGTSLNIFTVGVCWNARAIQRISDPEAMVFIVAARPLYILSMDITTCATTLQWPRSGPRALQ